MWGAVWFLLLSHTLPSQSLAATILLAFVWFLPHFGLAYFIPRMAHLSELLFLPTFAKVWLQFIQPNFLWLPHFYGPNFGLAKCG
jgi:hypothetical protein